MRITRGQLRQIIKEEIIREQSEFTPDEEEAVKILIHMKRQGTPYSDSIERGLEQRYEGRLSREEIRALKDEIDWADANKRDWTPGQERKFRTLQFLNNPDLIDDPNFGRAIGFEYSTVA